MKRIINAIKKLFTIRRKSESTLDLEFAFKNWERYQAFRLERINRELPDLSGRSGSEIFLNYLRLHLANRPKTRQEELEQTRRNMAEFRQSCRMEGESFEPVC